MAGWVGGRVGGLSETGNKAISASIEVEVELSWIELRLSLAIIKMNKIIKIVKIIEMIKITRIIKIIEKLK